LFVFFNIAVFKIPIKRKTRWNSNGLMAEREGFEDFSKSGNVEKSRKE
jgi:hypothetical protein